MTARTKQHPIIGNLIITETPTTVHLRLVTNHDGIARFSYREIAMVAATLAAIKPPVEEDEDDWRDLV